MNILQCNCSVLRVHRDYRVGKNTLTLSNVCPPFLAGSKCPAISTSSTSLPKAFVLSEVPALSPDIWGFSAAELKLGSSAALLTTWLNHYTDSLECSVLWTRTQNLLDHLK